ncbi:protein FAR1-RELATED SEQUENCE 5-like [Cornus florida]|uniref:protein FAR1-RELATED SEQUENCE 5-like n=1 Tax=Cornus florida TaxID=4283 RepID=UPI0028A2A7B3|nr:protein FAR1-RELATED SEQUENCE 5-like [Cornus florida]
MVITYDKTKAEYVVSKFVESHNHPFIIAEWSHMMPSQRRISSVQAIDVELASDSKVSACNAYELMGRQFDGKESVGYLKVDLKNYLRTRRQKELLYGEAFGDVISFDTTYKVVHGNRPFAIFLGMNHYREIAVFGAALMYDEIADSFVWLFETFLKVMSRKAPKTIITDQDAVMAKALKQVMPVTKHHLCVWHLMNNAQKNLLFLFKRVEGVKKVISKLMFQIEEEDDFIREWNLMIAEYGVAGNKWLSTLLDLRHKWALAFVKHDWSAGMSSTQLSESFNGQLKYYLSRQLILPEFFTHFDRLLSDKRYKEYEAEYGLVER